MRHARESKIICVDPLVASEWHISRMRMREKDHFVDKPKKEMLREREREKKEKTAHSDQFQ